MFAGQVVKFFVGEASGPDGAWTEAALRRENETWGDVVQVEGLVDAATNVSSKLLASLSYFADLSPSPTHYVRVEDDVYLFAERLARALRVVADGDEADSESTRGADRLDRRILGQFYTNESAFSGLRYPRGFAVVVPRRVVDGLAALERAVGFGVRSASEARGEAVGRYGAPAGAKGGWVRDHFWCDDQYLGLLLHPLDVDLVSESRFHDLPGRGPHGGRLSHASLALNGVQSDDEFESIHQGTALASSLSIHQRSWRRVVTDGHALVLVSATQGRTRGRRCHVVTLESFEPDRHEPRTNSRGPDFARTLEDER